MRKPASQLPISSIAGLEELRGFVEALNTVSVAIPLTVPSMPLMQPRYVKLSCDYRPIRDELRRLVKMWRSSGPNVVTLFKQDEELAQAALSVECVMIPTKEARAKLVPIASPQNMEPTNPQFIPFGLFLGFLLNPINERLGGPCNYCDNYFVKRTQKKRSSYCSQHCATRFTSRLANQLRRQEERRDQLKAVIKATQEWSQIRTKVVWKDWVSKRARVSKNFITRAVREGAIYEPDSPKRLED